MKYYFSYTRVSTVKQGQNGTSLSEQREAIHRYALRNNLEIIKEFEETETAAKRGRPVFTQMLKELRKGKVDGVILHKIDRGARNLKDWADLGELIDEGIDIHFAHESLDLHSRGGRLSADIQAVVAADYIRNLREETKKGFYGRLKQGLYPLPAPVGYLDKGKGVKEPHPEQAHLVRKAFELYATGKRGLIELVEEMYALGLRNRKGGKITRNGMSWFLRNPFYIGLIRVSSSGEIFSGSHEPLISKELFDRVQDILDGKYREKNHKHFFIFRKLLKCTFCGYKLVGEVHKGYTYYRCHIKGCPQKTIRENVIENELLEKLKKIRFTKEENEYLRQKIKDSYQNIVQFRETQTKALRLRVDQIKDRISKLTDAYIDGLLEKEIYLDKKSALILEEKGARENLEKLGNAEHKVLERIEKYLELANNAYLSYEMANPSQKRDLVKITTSNLTAEGKKAVIELDYSFTLAEKRPEKSNGGPYRAVPRTLDAIFSKLFEYFTKEPLDN